MKHVQQSSDIDQRDLLFVTTCIGTRWVLLQQHLIKKHFPHARSVLIDGNLRWDFALQDRCVWYDFIKAVISKENSARYFVCVDEDCFLLDPAGINQSILRMEQEGLSLIGPSDVIENIRDENPSALNSFLMIGKKADLARVWENYNFDLKFADLKLDLKKPDRQEVADYEPYYVFFWNYYLQGLKIGFIPTSFSEEFKCSVVNCLNGTPFAYHMWYTRYWFKTFEICGMPNRLRYRSVQAYLTRRFSINGWSLLRSVNLWQFSRVIFSRLIFKNIQRVRRRLVFLGRKSSG